MVDDYIGVTGSFKCEVGDLYPPSSPALLLSLLTTLLHDAGTKQKQAVAVSGDDGCNSRNAVEAAAAVEERERRQRVVRPSSLRVMGQGREIAYKLCASVCVCVYSCV